MKQLARFVLVVALFALAFGPSFAEEKETDVTLNGQFVWARDDGDRTGDLKAVFTPTGENEWSVSFYFDWEDGPHVWSGTAKGSLTEGALKGEVNNDSEERPQTFRFSGSFTDGLFEGKHAGVRDDKENELGSLTLKAAA